MMTLAQEYLLLVLDETAGGPRIAGSPLKYGLAGAVLADLALAQRVELADDDGGPHDRPVTVRSSAPLGDPVLDASLRELVADKPRPVQAIMTRTARDIRPRVADQLLDAGVLHRDERRALRIVPAASWPQPVVTSDREARSQLAAALDANAQPEDRTAALVALFDATGTWPGPQPEQLARRAAQIVGAPWSDNAARDVVAECIAVIGALVSDD